MPGIEQAKRKEKGICKTSQLTQKDFNMGLRKDIIK